MLTVLLAAAAVLGLIGLILGAAVAVTAKKFEVETDPREAEVLAALPNANCGGCGFAGCSDLAKAIVHDNVSPAKCSVCTEAQLQKIEAVLGRTAESAERKIAVVFCSGSLAEASKRVIYNGIQDCRFAAVVADGGAKDCKYGCIGYGSCARACAFNAIEILDGLAVVHPERCRGCGKCVGVCPRNLIRLVPASAKRHVFCNSPEPPQERRKVCRAACLACRKCIRAVGGSMTFEAGRVAVNYAVPAEEAAWQQVQCPAHVLLTPEEHRDAVLAGKRGEK